MGGVATTFDSWCPGKPTLNGTSFVVVTRPRSESNSSLCWGEARTHVAAAFLCDQVTTSIAESTNLATTIVSVAATDGDLGKNKGTKPFTQVKSQKTSQKGNQLHWSVPQIKMLAQTRRSHTI